MIASTLGLPPPPSAAPPPPKTLDTDSVPTPPPPPSSQPGMETVDEHTNIPRMERRSHPRATPRAAPRAAPKKASVSSLPHASPPETEAVDVKVGPSRPKHESQEIPKQNKGDNVDVKPTKAIESLSSSSKRGVEGLTAGLKGNLWRRQMRYLSSIQSLHSQKGQSCPLQVRHRRRPDAVSSSIQSSDSQKGQSCPLQVRHQRRRQMQYLSSIQSSGIPKKARVACFKSATSENHFKEYRCV